MKELHFKKWVKNLLLSIIAISITLVCSVEFESILSELIFLIICMTLITVNTILLGIFE